MCSAMLAVSGRKVFIELCCRIDDGDMAPLSQSLGTTLAQRPEHRARRKADSGAWFCHQRLHIQCKSEQRGQSWSTRTYQLGAGVWTQSRAQAWLVG